MSKRLKPTSEMEARVRKAIDVEEQPEVIAVNKARGQHVFTELNERQLEFADVITALKEAREHRGMSHQYVCDKTGITRASLSLMENGHGNPTMTTLRRDKKVAGTENKIRGPANLACGTSVRLSDALKPPSRGNALSVDDVWRLMNAEVKGGSAASEGSTEVPHSRKSRQSPCGHF